MNLEADDGLHFGGEVVEAPEEKPMDTWHEEFPRQRGTEDARHLPGMQTRKRDDGFMNKI